MEFVGEVFWSWFGGKNVEISSTFFITFGTSQPSLYLEYHSYHPFYLIFRSCHHIDNSCHCLYILDQSLMMKWIIETLEWSTAICMVFGPVIGYVDQYQKTLSTRSTEGFSHKVCGVLLVSNMLRILFWIGKRFDSVLLWQSIVMILAQLILLGESFFILDGVSEEYNFLRGMNLIIQFFPLCLFDLFLEQLKNFVCGIYLLLLIEFDSPGVR